ncbi:MAG: hypothetical protein JWP58_3543 [Hymenobacter sp.]|nr:hypothetical protein [Hymenobacter sp.]
METPIATSVNTCVEIAPQKADFVRDISAIKNGMRQQ